MAKKSFLGAAGVAASFISAPTIMAEEEREEAVVVKETKKVEMKSAKSETKNEKVVDMKKETKVEVKAMAKPVMKVESDDEMRTTFTLNDEMIRKIKVDCAMNDVQVKDILFNAMKNFDSEKDEIIKIDADSRMQRTYQIANETGISIKMIAMNKKVNASDVAYSALKKYYHM